MSFVDRRDFLKGAAASLAGAQATLGQGGNAIALVIDPKDAIAMSGPVQWAVKELGRVFPLTRYDSIEAVPPNRFCIIATGRGAQNAPDALALSFSGESGRRTLTASGSDARGLVYAILEIADRVRN